MKVPGLNLPGFARARLGHGTEELSFGERMSDAVARHGGSWSFVFTASAAIVGWIAYNNLSGGVPDPGLLKLNLAMSTMAVLQGPFLIMSQNRQAAKDRASAERDLAADLHTEKQVMELHTKIDTMGADLHRLAEALAARDKPAP